MKKEKKEEGQRGRETVDEREGEREKDIGGKER